MSLARIVVIEDNAADVLLMEEALKQHGLECALEHFSNGEDAAKAISGMADAPDLFVVDLNLPRVHGLELLRLIRACPMVSDAPVAILTSSRAPGDKTKSEQLGADAYIVKPTGYTEFVENVGSTISRLLQRKSPGAWSGRRCGRRNSSSRIAPLRWPVRSIPRRERRQSNCAGL